MTALTLRVFLLIVHLPLVGGLAVNTILGDRVQFPETEQCRERGATLQHTLTGGSSQTVARLEDVWKPAAGYKDRMSPNESDHTKFLLFCFPSLEQKETPWFTIAIIAALVLVALGVVCRQRICRSNVSPGGGRSLTEEESQPITDPRVPEENGHALSA
ncbi:Complement C4 [Dissostichus eleginoides]|uniref:Complement C4 n=1 Tax=Dissostichus eleginoides TaxID=100907 RepID=A0AAD9BVU8_DISEL|nr:Complement C4 [Dissostichus eleginoides]